jgi:hypothetical protein
MLLSDLLTDRGWTEEEVVAKLAEHEVTFRRGDKKGQPIGLDYVQKRGSSEIPKVWFGALGVLEDPADDGDQAGGTNKGRRSERPPVAPAGTIPVLIVDNAGAKKRIAGAYKFVGAALAQGAQSPGVAEVWKDSADPIAELWLEAAKENPWAARFVNMMQAGGVTGDLAAAHLYLLGASAYVLGYTIPAGDAVFAKYSRYRPVVYVQPAGEPAGASENGSGVVDEAAAGAAETRLG